MAGRGLDVRDTGKGNQEETGGGVQPLRGKTARDASGDAQEAYETCLQLRCEHLTGERGRAVELGPASRRRAS